MTNHPNRTWRWTQDNTQGFTDAQLDHINHAIQILRGQLRRDQRSVDMSNLNDAINDAWAEQETPDQLAADTLKQLGG
jgi:hypothetical protein